MAMPTTTSYAILGLLAIRSWTTYELAQQMERSVRHIWPRAQSRIYEEPKRLVELGYAEAVKDHVGRRPRTTYSITDAGRDALRTWLETPGAGPVLEFEALLKVFFAEHATPAGIRENLAAIRAWTEDQNAENVALARLYRDTGGPFPDRLASIILIGKFMTDFTDMLTAWCTWADETVAQWPDDAPPSPPWDVIEAIASRPGPVRALPG